MNEGSSSQIEYASETELLADFKKHMCDPANLERATNYLYNSLVDETIMGVVFELHYLHKTGLDVAIEGEPEDPTKFSIVDMPDMDVFGSTNTKKAVDCTCPNCDRPVASSRFAPHLEKCMGIGRNSSRIASRRIANSRDGNNYFGNNISDDEDDADWSSDKKKKKIQSMRTNGSKKNGK
ncbi:SAGA-associated factor 11 homolog [Contarinia nasturtii]|uniref:SAGA-associated factor 11 homolog n=1 Tax=Contarinia nasturtii TaxID=265458 RepID=UPI0012D3FB1D|nr:SAGA-associated factor 11 homolog [Contarinia nasturtii]